MNTVSMSTMTRAAVLSAPRTPFTVRDVELADLREHEVLVRMVATGARRSRRPPRATRWC